MRERTLRNEIVESSLSLPVMSVFTFLLWASTSEWSDVMLWLSLAIVAVMAYVIVEWNNQCQLLRIRSRMNSVTFLALVNIFPLLHTAGLALVPALCLLLTYFMLFKSYGEYKPQGYAFHGFFFLGVGSLFFPPMLLLAPTLFVSCNTQLRILTLRTMSALTLGLLLPFWLYTAAMAAASALWGLKETRLSYFSLRLPDYSGIETWQWGALALVLVLGLISVGHFLATSYNDKIRTRQFFFTMIPSFVPLLFFMAWWPEDFLITLPLLLLNLTPFMAHFMALSKIKYITFVFWFIAFTAFLLGVVNYCDLWPYLYTGIDLPELLRYIPI